MIDSSDIFGIIRDKIINLRYTLFDNIFGKILAVCVLLLATMLILPMNMGGLGVIRILIGYWACYKAFKIWKQEE